MQQARTKIKKLESSLRLARNRERNLRREIDKMRLIIDDKIKQRERWKMKYVRKVKKHIKKDEILNEVKEIEKKACWRLEKIY